jgi:hypothetical protein
MIILATAILGESRVHVIASAIPSGRDTRRTMKRVLLNSGRQRGVPELADWGALIIPSRLH